MASTRTQRRGAANIGSAPSSSTIATDDALEPAASLQGPVELVSIKKMKINVNAFSKAISSDAALAFGQKIWDFQQAEVAIIGARVNCTVSTPTGLSSTAGEIGLGSVVASGAVAVLGGTGTFEDIMTGHTVSNLVAGTPNTETHVAGIIAGSLDGTATAKDVFLNYASTWNQTAAESVTISGTVEIFYVDLGDD